MKAENYSKIDETEPVKVDIPVKQYDTIQATTVIPESLELQSKWCRCLTKVKSLTVEPVMFLFMFAYILNTTCLTNMIMDKGCLYYFNYSEKICSNLTGNSTEKDNVEILANNYNLYLNLLAPIGAIIVIFLAPWSDKHGRKPPLVLALFGFFLNDIGIILCTVYFESSIDYIIVSNLASQFTGGFICVMTIIYSLSSESSSSESRSLKYTSLQIAFGLAVTLGALTGGQLYHYYGYLTVYVTMASCHLVAIAWVICAVKETKGLDRAVTCRQKIRDLFLAQNFTDGVRVCIRSRGNRGRAQLWLLMFSSCTIALTYEVYTDIAYVYAHHQFDWGPTTYSEVWTVCSLAEMIVVLICAPLFIKVFKFGDPLIGLIGTVSMIGKNIFLALAYQVWLFYTSNIFGFLNGLGNLAVRSLISKLVSEDELGRVFSFLATFEAIVPLLGSAVITKIFNATIKTFPGMCYLAATIFLLLPLGTFIWEFKMAPKNHIIMKKQ